ncbi:hypothetical protein M405DRAFT_815111 [Rhizopogon salebrosus TDB-379]|nr:hypothetical protein M405DRAFT_815111 [Rhizopogon salebrosus TDB-379]
MTSVRMTFFSELLPPAFQGAARTMYPPTPGGSPLRSTPHAPPHVDCPRTHGWPHGKHCFPHPRAGASTQATGP